MVTNNGSHQHAAGGEISQTVEKFFETGKTHVFKRGTTIIRPDEEPTRVFLIKSGYVKMNILYANGRDLTVNIFKPGTFFPLLGLIGNVSNSYAFEAMSDVDVVETPVQEMNKFIKHNPDVLLDVSSRIFRGFHQLIGHMQHLIYLDARHKTLTALKLLIQRFGEADGDSIRITIPITHQEIASIAGLTRETATVELNKLKRMGIIDASRKKLTVRSYTKLNQAFENT